MYLFEHEDFEDLLSQTARATGLPFAFVEKDYWVSYVLFRLRAAGVDDFVFKGGTSLTKGWALLDRFSEDIDLLFISHDLTRENKAKRLKKIQKLVMTFGGLTFDKERSKSGGHYRADSFQYKRFENHEIGPLLPYIRLEMGFRGGAEPSELREIQSYLGRELQRANQEKIAVDVLPFKIPILDIRRTFVEKLFAIHSAFENKQVKKYFRHYYDVFKLLSREEITKFLATSDFGRLKKDVADMSDEFFEKTHFPEELSFSNSRAFQKDNDLTKILNEALKEQRGLFFLEPPSGEEIMESLATSIGKSN